MLAKAHVVSLREYLVTVVETKTRTFSSIHPNTSKTDFKIISSGFKNNCCRRKIAEAILIKQIKPSLNVQEKSYELKLFNHGGSKEKE